MQRSSKLIQANQASFPACAYYLPLFSKARRNVSKHPDICIETCKSLLEGISKTIILGLDAAAISSELDKKDVEPLVKSAAKLLKANDDVIEENFVNRVSGLAHSLGALRNARGDISHGKAVPKVKESSSDFARLSVFAEFDWADLDLDNQTFDEFKSKYLDIHDLTRKQSEEGTVSIVNDVDFELELIRQDKINVAYILQLLRDLKDEDKPDGLTAPVDHEKRLADILDMVASEAQLRSKRELIEKFIQQNMAQLAPADDVTAVFKAYWNQEKEVAFAAFCAQEGLDRERFDKLVDQFNFNGQPPLRDDVVATLIERPKILERRKIVDRIIDKMRSLVRTFEDDLGEI